MEIKASPPPQPELSKEGAELEGMHGMQGAPKRGDELRSRLVGYIDSLLDDPQDENANNNESSRIDAHAQSILHGEKFVISSKGQNAELKLDNQDKQSDTDMKNINNTKDKSNNNNFMMQRDIPNLGLLEERGSRKDTEETAAELISSQRKCEGDSNLGLIPESPIIHYHK